MWNLNIWEDIFDWLNIMQFHMHDICETWKVKDVPVSQLKPVHPLLHVQLYEPGLLWHVPCVQGSERHSSISSKRERVTRPFSRLKCCITGWLFMKISVWQTILHILHLLCDCQPVKPLNMNCLLFSRKGIELKEFELPVLQYWSVNPVWQVQKKLPGVLVQSPCWHGWEVAHSFMSKTKQSHESKNEVETRGQFGHIAQ